MVFSTISIKKKYCRGKIHVSPCFASQSRVLEWRHCIYTLFLYPVSGFRLGYSSNMQLENEAFPFSDHQNFCNDENPTYLFIPKCNIIECICLLHNPPVDFRACVYVFRQLFQWREPVGQFSRLYGILCFIYFINALTNLRNVHGYKENRCACLSKTFSRRK